MTRTTAIGYYHQNMVGLTQRLTDHLDTPPANAPRERMWHVRAQQVVLAQARWKNRWSSIAMIAPALCWQVRANLSEPLRRSGRGIAQ